MTRQMGSASGTAPASRESEATPGGASELMSESMVDGEASGITGADWPEPGTAELGRAQAGSSTESVEM
jgi:hypothetical protein